MNLGGGDDTTKCKQRCLALRDTAYLMEGGRHLLSTPLHPIMEIPSTLLSGTLFARCSFFGFAQFPDCSSAVCCLPIVVAYRHFLDSTSNTNACGLLRYPTVFSSPSGFFLRSNE